MSVDIKYIFANKGLYTKIEKLHERRPLFRSIAAAIPARTTLVRSTRCSVLGPLTRVAL